MKPRRRIFVVGGAHSPFIGKHHPDFVWKGHPDYGKRENPTLEGHIGASVRGAFEATGVQAAAIDKGYIGNFLGELFSRQGHLGAMVVAADPGLEGTPFARIEGACASGALAVTSCIESMQAGYDVTLAVGAEVESNAKASDGVEYMARAAHWDKERPKERFLFPWMFARRAKHYKEAFGADDSDIGRVVVKAYANAKANPNAHMKDAPEITLEQASVASASNHTFLEDAEYHDHIRFLDCTHFSDGASAVVLATEEGLAKLGVSQEACTEILSYGHTTSALGAETDPRRLTTMAAAASEAYADSGVTPDQLDVAEVHDCFAITEIQLYEALGFAAEGQANRLLREGVTNRDGALPVNTGGGLLGFGHPVGATGVKQVLEIWRQMKGRCGDYQLPCPPTHGVTSNLGGDDRTGVVMVHRNLD